MVIIEDAFYIITIFDFHKVKNSTMFTSICLWIFFSAFVHM